MKTFEIYFDDLNEEAKAEYLVFVGADYDSDLNHENLPLAIVEVEDAEV